MPLLDDNEWRLVGNPLGLQRTPSGLFRRAVGDTAVDLAKGVVGFGQSAVGLADLATAGLAGDALNYMGYDPQRTQQFFGQYYSPERQEAEQAVQSAEGFVDTTGALLQNPSTIFGRGVQSAPMLLGSMGVANRVYQGSQSLPRAVAAGHVTEGAMTAGSVAQGIREEGGSRGDMYWAVPAGVATGAIGYGAGRFLPEGQIESLLIPGARAATASGAPAGLLRRTAASALSEGVLEEMPQSAQEQMFTNLGLGRDPMYRVPEAAGEGLVVGGATGGVLGPFRRGAPQPSQLLPGANPGATSAAAPAPIFPSVPPTLDLLAAQGTQGDLFNGAGYDTLSQGAYAGRQPNIEQVAFRRAQAMAELEELDAQAAQGNQLAAVQAQQIRNELAAMPDTRGQVVWAPSTDAQGNPTMVPVYPGGAPYAAAMPGQMNLMSGVFENINGRPVELTSDELTQNRVPFVPTGFDPRTAGLALAQTGQVQGGLPFENVGVPPPPPASPAGPRRALRPDEWSYFGQPLEGDIETTPPADQRLSQITAALRYANGGKYNAQLGRFIAEFNRAIEQGIGAVDELITRYDNAKSTLRPEVFETAAQMAQDYQTRMTNAYAAEGLARAQPGRRVGQAPASTATEQEMRQRNAEQQERDTQEIERLYQDETDNRALEGQIRPLRPGVDEGGQQRLFDKRDAPVQRGPQPPGQEPPPVAEGTTTPKQGILFTKKGQPSAQATKEATDAVQKPSPAPVPPRERARAGQPVGEGVPGQGQAPAEGQAKPEKPKARRSKVKAKIGEQEVELEVDNADEKIAAMKKDIDKYEAFVACLRKK